MNTRTVVSMILAWMVPGAGHFYLGRRGRAVAFFVIVTFMFLIGLSLDGGLYTIVTSSGSWLKMLATVASMGSGLLYFIAWRIGVPGDIVSATFEYGSAFTLTSGLMNLLLVIDCHDIASGRKTTGEPA
jgi:TM2 domain-containing membrane protein YozV